MKYQVKTRNWACDKTIFKLIAFVPHKRGDGYTDGDGKFYHDTDSLLIALVIWAYWRLLALWSGGWTYVRDNTKYPHGLPCRQGFVASQFYL